MRFPSLVRSAVLVVAVLGFATVARATPITYELSGIASGMIGGSGFMNALVQLTVTGDTDNIVTEFGGLAFVNVSSATMVTIAGVGTATVTDPNAIYAFPAPVLLDEDMPFLPYVVIGTLDNPPLLDSFTGLGLVGGNALLGYDLQTSIGPVTATGGVGYPMGLFVHTTLGDLSFTSNISSTTEGTFAAAPVPEPMSLLLLGSGIAVLAGRSRFRPRS